MPDVSQDIREVYEMVTKQKPTDPGALERQHTRQVRTMRNRKIGAFAVTTAIAVTAVAVILGTRGGNDTTTTTTGVQTTPTPVEVATGFLEAYGAFDADRAITYLADDADISGLMGTVGTEGIEGTPQELSVLISWLDATGYEQMVDPCQETESFSSGTLVHCTYAFDSLGSDELGLGPYRGSYFDLTVRDGLITQASVYWEVEKFSPRSWEPFARWVARVYPTDAAVMYEGADQTVARPTRESIQLWARHTRGYVKHVKA